MTDYLNRPVILSQPAQRIVALSPHIVENIFTIGAGSALVGVVEHSDFPQQAKEIARIGGVTSFSIEKILSLSPDLVIVWASAARSSIVEKLTSLGITVYVDDPRRLVDIARSIRDFGVLAGRVRQSEAEADNYLSKMRQLHYQYQHINSISVFYEVWNSPLQTVNRNHIISDVIALCGAKNVFGDALSLAPKINIEAVINRNPDIVIASNTAKPRQEWLNYWLQWPSLNAVRYGRLYFIDPDLIQRHTVRILVGAEMLCGYVSDAAAIENQR